MAVREVAGIVLLIAPGAAWTWALFPRLDWAKAAFLALVVALTLPPATFYALSFRGPVGTAHAVAAAFGWAALGLGVGAWDRRRRQRPA